MDNKTIDNKSNQQLIIGNQLVHMFE